MAKKKKGVNPILLIAIIFVIFILITILPKTISAITVSMPKNRTHPQANFNKMGNPEAPVSLIIYSDFQCSHCARFYENTEQLLIDEYVETGKINYEFKTFGDSLGPESLLAAEASYCAADQGKFWEYHNVLYENFSYNNSGGYAEKKLIKFAEKLDLDIDSFESCLISNKYEKRAMQDIEDGKASGVGGTPSILLDGVVTFPGNVSIEDMRPILDAAVEAALQK